jgi:hypothetical protein
VSSDIVMLRGFSSALLEDRPNIVVSGTRGHVGSSVLWCDAAYSLSTWPT